MAPLTKISRRKAIAAAGAGLVAARSAFAQQTKPNIVYIMADDMGYADVSCYGRKEYQTPNIDSLARDGMKFMQGYANSAVCTATRVALMTGRYQYRLPVGLEEPLPSAGARETRCKASMPLPIWCACWLSGAARTARPCNNSCGCWCTTIAAWMCSKHAS